jgi:uncharacterized protein
VVRSVPCNERNRSSLTIMRNMMENFQTLFHEQWQNLRDPHVRSLAWILTSPGMLAKESALWKQQIAYIALPEKIALSAWLTELDQHPAELYEALALHKHRRLGHYAENLLAFYLRHQGVLYAHGLQVHVEGCSTLGEFDFLLHLPDGLHHWEIATKFYLFEEGEDRVHQADLFDYLGPNLADTLGKKMDKIFRRRRAETLAGKSHYCKSLDQRMAVLSFVIVSACSGWPLR